MQPGRGPIVTKEALRQLEPELLADEMARLENSMRHLMRSNDELEQFVRESAGDDDVAELVKAVKENEQTLASQRQRLEMIRDVLSEKLGRNQVERHYSSLPASTAAGRTTTTPQTAHSASHDGTQSDSQAQDSGGVYL